MAQPSRAAAKRPTRSRLPVGLALAGLMALAAGAPATLAAARPVTVTFWESHSAGGPPGKAVSALVAMFNRTHPGIRVVLTVTKASHKLLGAFAAGDPPVLAMVSHYDQAFITAHAILSWNPYLTGADGMPQAERNSFFPVAWQNGEVSGQHYRLQADAKISQLTYNVAMFRKAGIKTPPTTWAELATDVAILKKKLPGVIPLAWKDSSAHILPPFLSNGGTIFAPGSAGKRANFLTPAATETFTYFRNLYAKHEMIVAHGAEIRADFGAGRLAIADGTSAGYQKILDAAGGRFPVGVFAYPAGASGHSANLSQGLGFVLVAHHTAAQDAAAATFVAWWFGARAQAYWGTHSGYPPETRIALPLMSSYLATHPGIAVSVATLESPYTVGRPIPTAYKEVQASLDAAFFNAVTGSESVATALHSLESQANAYLSGSAAL